MRGQLSVEMLVVIVIILGLVVLMATVFMNSANRAAEKADEQTEQLVSGEGAKLAKGMYCSSDDDCQSGSCDSSTRRCG